MTEVRWIAVALLSGSLVLGGCSLLEEPQSCTLVALPGVKITLLDAVSADVIVDPGARVHVRDGDYEETLGGRNGVFWGAWDRPGRYDITASSPGYGRALWFGAEVEDAECGIETFEETLRLRPSS